MKAIRLSPLDLYRLRRARLGAQVASLQAQMAQHHLDCLLLELERRYGLIATESTLDLKTGLVSAQEKQGEEPPHSPQAESKGACPELSRRGSP